MSEHLVDVGRRSARERIAHFLLEFSTRLVANGIGTANAFALPLSQVQLADIVSLSIPHTNRVLKRLCREGVLQMTGRRIQIVDRRALAELAGFDDSYLLSVRRALNDHTEKSSVDGIKRRLMISSMPGIAFCAAGGTGSQCFPCAVK